MALSHRQIEIQHYQSQKPSTWSRKPALPSLAFHAEPPTGPASLRNLPAPSRVPAGLTAANDSLKRSFEAGAAGNLGTTADMLQHGEKKLAQQSVASRPITQVRQHDISTSIVLQNRHNHCYVNSAALLLIKAASCATGPIGDIHNALSDIDKSGPIDLLQHPSWVRLLQGWRRPRQQHDVTELLHHMSGYLNGAVLEGEWATNRPTQADPRRLIDRSPTCPYITMNLESATSIQEVIQHWHGTQPLNALVTAPQLICHQPRTVSVSQRPAAQAQTKDRCT